MGRTGRILAVLIVIAAVVGVVLYVMRGPIAVALMQSAVERNLGTDPWADKPDGLYVAMCGAGSPLPDPGRGGPCVAVAAVEGGAARLFVVDTGSGASRTLGRMGLPVGGVTGVLLTHFHSDHIDGLGELAMQRWANGAATSPLPVIGPEGVRRVVDGFNEAYALDFTYRIAHHGEAIVPPSGAGVVAAPFTSPPKGVGVPVIDADGLIVTAFLVDHFPVVPSVGYRFDFMGRSVVISGDTERSENVALFATEADILFHEALSPELVQVLTDGAEAAGRDNIATITRDILDYHTPPVEAAEIAEIAGAKSLVFYHIVPPLPLDALESVFMKGVGDAYAGPAHIATDGDTWSLPAGTTDIDFANRF